MHSTTERHSTVGGFQDSELASAGDPHAKWSNGRPAWQQKFRTPDWNLAVQGTGKLVCLDRLAVNEPRNRDEEFGKLEARLQSELRGRVRNLRVLVIRAGIVLRGEATTYYAKQLAQQEVLRMALRLPIHNEIRVLRQSNTSEQQFSVEETRRTISIEISTNFTGEKNEK